MRLKLLLSAIAVMVPFDTASAQDSVVTLILQRVCFDFVEAEASTLATADTAARALNLTFAGENTTRVGSRVVSESKKYTLLQPGGVYKLQVIDSRYSIRYCSVEAPAGVSASQVQQAATNAVGDDWEVEFGPNGPTWIKILDWDFRLRMGAGLVTGGNAAAWVESEEFAEDE